MTKQKILLWDSWVSEKLTWKKFSQREKITLFLPTPAQCEDRQEALSWEVIQKNPFQSYQTWTFWPNHALKDRERRKENINGFYLPELQGVHALGRQEREPYGAAQPCHTYSVSLVLASSMRLFFGFYLFIFFSKKNPKQVVLFSLCAFVLKLQRVSET